VPAPKSLPLFLLLPVIGACATRNLRPDPTVAVLGSRGAVVHAIDDRNVREDGAAAGQARFEIPPGPHAVAVTLDTGAKAAARANDGATVLTVCFGAVAGHSYLARPVIDQNRWRPEIIDEESGDPVESGCQERPEPSAAPASVAAPDVNAASAPVAVNAPPPDPPQDAPVADLPLPATSASLDANLPGSGVYLEVGFFFGGQPLYKVQFDNGADRSLYAGRGVGASLGGVWTPLWTRDRRVGFGVGGSASWKYDHIAASNGSASLTRFPVAASVHALVRLDDRWFGLVRGGVGTEVGGHLSGSGFAAAIDDDLTATWGLVGEAGLYRLVDRAALGGGLRYARLSDRFAGTEVDASSLGIFASAQYSF
jgi:hypothetical protein